ncbi:hypothetical protein HK102_005735 [Quaeritorhiza haematococci]|nr:hypothetical protein HK102_005735 [Quaeritorhiza haematococci]
MRSFHRRVALRDDKLAVIVGCLYIPDIILLAIWLSKRPLGPIFVEESGESQVLKCYSDTSGYPWALFAYGLVKLLVALRYTYLTRNVFSRFNETKTVLFAVYNVSIGLVIGIVSFAITGLQREGAMLLLLIALAGTSFGTSASVVGSRVIYAFVDMTSGNKRKFASNSGAVGGISKGKTDTGYDQNPQILGRRGLKDPLDVSMMSSGVSHFVADISTNAGKHKDEDYIGQGDLIGFEGSIRQRSMLVWTSKWYTCLILVGTVNKEPNLILSVYDGVTGSPKLAPTWSVVLAQNQVTDVAVVEGCAVKIDSTRGTFDIDFPSASLAARFVEEYERRIGKDNKVDDKRNGSKAS